MKNNNKGFTLLEMLIVVAIIAILATIAIPTFTSQMEKAREGVDLANLRSCASSIAADAIGKSTSVDPKYVELTQTKQQWQYVDAKDTDSIQGLAAAAGSTKDAAIASKYIVVSASFVDGVTKVVMTPSATVPTNATKFS